MDKIVLCTCRNDSAFGRLSPRPLQGFCPWTPLDTSVPRPILLYPPQENTKSSGGGMATGLKTNNIVAVFWRHCRWCGRGCTSTAATNWLFVSGDVHVYAKNTVKRLTIKIIHLRSRDSFYWRLVSVIDKRLMLGLGYWKGKGDVGKISYDTVANDQMWIRNCK